MRLPQIPAAAAALVVLLVGLVSMPAAWAATGKAATPPAAAASAPPSLDVELWPDHQQALTTFIVLATLPPSVRLPAVVRLPMPAATQQVTWSGEISGSETSQDVQQAVRQVAGLRGAVELTAKTSRQVQYEAVLGPTTIHGTRRSVALDWVQTAPTDTVTFAVRVPLAARNVAISPAPVGTPQSDPSLGQALYQLSPQRIATGSSQRFSVAYDVGTEAAKGAPAWLWVALVAAVAALIVAIAAERRRRRKAPAEAGDATGDGSDEDEE